MWRPTCWEWPWRSIAATTASSCGMSTEAWAHLRSPYVKKIFSLFTLMFYLIMSGHFMLYFVPETDTSPPSAREASQPIAEMGLSETCHNVAWTNSSNRTLLASMNMKFIKIFDLRGKVIGKMIVIEDYTHQLFSNSVT